MSAGFGEWEALGGDWRDKEERSQVFLPLCLEQYFWKWLWLSPPGSRFWTGHCGSSFCQVTVVHALLEHCFLPLSLVTTSHQTFPIKGQTVNILGLQATQSLLELLNSVNACGCVLIRLYLQKLENLFVRLFDNCRINS